MSATSVLEVRFSSFHEEVSKPSLHGVPNGKGVLVKVLRVGVDLTDEELRGKYGADAGSTIRVPDALTHVGGLLEPSPTGTAAISGKTSALLFQATVTGITPLRLNPKLPEQLEEIISKLLNKDGNLRYQGADELRNIIARLGRAAG